MDITKIDKNFLSDNRIVKENTTFYDVKTPPFSLYGVIYDEKQKRFLRMPQEIAEGTSEDVTILNTHTSGGRIRFSTDSDFIAVLVKNDGPSKMVHMPLTGSTGFILCEVTPNGEKYIESLVPQFDDGDTYLKKAKLKPGMHSYTLYFPIYNVVNEVFVALNKNATVGEGAPYEDVKPILYYGSSITQGGCSSRADLNYQSMICHKNNVNFINLGFSGSGKAEQFLARYMGGLNVSIAVFDYDYNADTLDFLQDTHYPLYKTFRDLKPDVPIIFISRPNYFRNPEDGEKRYQIIKDTYNRARAMGDKNVYILHGKDFFKDEYDICTVDGTHPNDIGFYKMANIIGSLINKLLKKKYGVKLKNAYKNLNK